MWSAPLHDFGYGLDCSYLEMGKVYLFYALQPSVYTNDLVEVQRNLDMYESMLEDRDPADRFMGLDLEYTSDGPNHEFA